MTASKYGFALGGLALATIGALAWKAWSGGEEDSENLKAVLHGFMAYDEDGHYISGTFRKS